MTKAYIRNLLGAVSLVALCAVSDVSSAQTIDEALAAAYRSNPQILAERARLRATDEGVPRALSNWRPVVTLQGQAGTGRDTLRTDTPAGTTTTDRTRSPYLAQLQVSQPLYRGGRTEAVISRAENLVQRGRAQLHAIEQQLLFDAATAYLDVLRDQAVLDLTVNNEQVLQRQLAATRDRFQVGEVTRTDVSQAESRLARARADRIQADGNLTSTRATYLKVIGSPPGQLVVPQPLANLPDSDQAVLEGATNNPNVISARFNEKAAQDDIDLVYGEKLPTVSLTGNLARQHETSTPGLERDVAEALVVVTVPLYQGGSVDARVRETKQTAGQRRIEVDDTLRQAREQATRSLETLTTARARVTAFREEIRSAQIALEGVEQEARVGSRTVLDVLDAEQELLNARVDLVRARRDELVAAYALAASIGRLTARDLGLSVDIYDPTAHYNQTRNRWYGTDPSDQQGAQ